MYNGGYDDMVLQKTSVRTRIEAQNEQREKKIAQLNDFIARFSAGTRSSPGELAQEGGRAPRHLRARPLEHRASVHLVLTWMRPSGKNVLEFENVNKSYVQKDGKTEHVIANFYGIGQSRRQGHPDGSQRPRARRRC